MQLIQQVQQSLRRPDVQLLQAACAKAAGTSALASASHMTAALSLYCRTPRARMQPRCSPSSRGARASHNLWPVPVPAPAPGWRSQGQRKQCQPQLLAGAPPPFCWSCPTFWWSCLKRLTLGQWVCSKVIRLEALQYLADPVQGQAWDDLGPDGPVCEHLLRHHQQVGCCPQLGEVCVTAGAATWALERQQPGPERCIGASRRGAT